jgi:Domain of unknown function (DUF4037)
MFGTIRRPTRNIEHLAIAHRWTTALGVFTPVFFRQHPVLSAFWDCAAIILHGSTTIGVDDEISDLDLWLVMKDDQLGNLDAASSTRFFEFQLEGKAGHFTAISAESCEERITRSDFPLIAELQTAQIVRDYNGVGSKLVRRASQEMPESVRRAFFKYHYIEFRSDDRAADHPLSRCDPVAALLAQTAALGHALRAVMLLHGEPYPYFKWLYRAALATPTGAAIAPLIDQWLNRLCLRNRPCPINRPSAP